MIQLHERMTGQLVKKGKAQELEFDYISVDDDEFSVLINIDCNKGSIYEDSYIAAKLPYKDALLLAQLLVERAKEAEKRYQEFLKEHPEV